MTQHDNGNRLDTGPTPAIENVFSTTVRSQKLLVVPKSKPFKGSFSIIC